MEIKEDKDRYYRSTSLPLATFLFAKEEQIAGVNDVNGSKDKEFCFVRTRRLDGLVETYKFGDRNNSDLLVEVHLYEQARREILERLYGR